MTDLDKYISDLLFEYDCVIVPQLGGFVTNYKPAQIDETRGIAHPPKKDIGFNRNLTRSDGLLEQAFAEAESISIKDASELVKSQVEGYWEKLNSGNKLKFKKIGVLYFDRDQKLQFEPSTETNYLQSAFGLDSFSLPEKIELPIREEKVEEETKVIPFEPAEETEEPVEIIHSKSRSIYWVAAASILPFVAMSIYFGVRTDFKSPTQASLAELVPGFKFNTEKRLYKERTVSEAESNSVNSDVFPSDSVFPYSFIESKIDSTGVWVDLRKKKTDIKPAIEKVTGPYHIITGCFSHKKNADKYVNTLQAKGYDASILDYHKKLHRVRISSFGTRTEALQNLKKIRTEEGYPKAWLLKKRTNS